MIVRWYTLETFDKETGVNLVSLNAMNKVDLYERKYTFCKPAFRSFCNEFLFGLWCSQQNYNYIDLGCYWDKNLT